MGDGNIHLIPFFSFAEWDALPERGAVAQRIRRAMNDVASSLRAPSAPSTASGAR